MVYLALKIFMTSVIVVLISEIAKQSSFLGSILASVPIVSVFGHDMAIYRYKRCIKSHRPIQRNILACDSFINSFSGIASFVKIWN